MSELKAITSGEIYNKIEYEGSCITDDLYYPKSEADKVIADLIEKNKRLARKDIIMASNAINDVYKELRHSKYKRCLAMAERCSERFHHYVALSAFSPNKGAIPFYDKMLHKAYRWKYKWLELAEKFKE